MIRVFTVTFFLTSLCCVRGDLLLSSSGKARCVIIRQAGATTPERKAAEELAFALEQITGAKFEIRDAGEKIPRRAIIIGPGAIAEASFPEIPFDQLGPDEIVMRMKGTKLLLADGRPRGTIYAVCRFLQQQCGVRWWTPWATTIPRQPTLRVRDLNMRYSPPFENRAPFWYPAFNPEWSYRNGSTDQNAQLTVDVGGCIKYAKSMCHSFYALVPPEKYFAKHPEWYSMIKGRRTHERAQLCLTNLQLRDFVVQRVKEWLQEVPDANIVSVTQNDWNGWCECSDCKTLDDAEGSHAGTMLTFANYIAERIEPEFPKVAIDTFAYTYTRTPPKNVKVRPQVVVRLCSIECSFREPLDHPSNAAFANDLRQWSRICPRLYIWDYTTDFRNYVHPHPNWFTLGANVRFFQAHGVKGVFEQGAYQGHGAEMAEMRAWVLAQLMWNPQQDDRALIREFLEGYYGAEGAAFVRRYLELMHNASQGLFLGCYLRKEWYPHLNFATLSAAERLWQQAEDAALRDPEKLARMRVAHLPVRYAFLRTWNRLRRECWEQNSIWPLPESRKAVAEEFRIVCEGIPGKDWTKVGTLNESGLTVEAFLKDFAEDPPDKFGPPPPVRLTNPPAPSDLGEINSATCVDLPDNLASLARPGKMADIHPDLASSDGRAVWMPGDHQEWAFRLEGARLPPKAQSGKWKLYAVVRVKKLVECKADSMAFAAGVYDNEKRNHVAGFTAVARDVNNDYRSYLIGTAEMNSGRDIWVAPASNPGVKSIWIDRIYLVPSP